MKRKTGLWRSLTVATVILAVLSIMLSGVAQTYAAMVNKTLGINTSMLVPSENAENTDTQYYKSEYATLEELYQAKVDLMRRIAQEGTILLKNENSTLPIASGKITLLGGDNFVFATDHGGASMTAATVTRATTLKKALEYDGLTVNTSASQAEGSIATLVVLGRVAGEGADMTYDGLKLTDEEKELISKAKEIGSPVIVLTSGDYYPMLEELVNDPQISAILHLGNAGYRGAYGFADVFTGKVSPSGKTVETVAADPTSAPAMMNFGDYKYTNGSAVMASQAKTYVVYMEGIYTDYKYYETRYEDCVLNNGNAASGVGVVAGKGSWSYTDEVLYGYGYGLSYTEFTQELVGDPVFDDAERTATLQVKVTNVGSVAGKEVVQLYGQSPYTEYDKENKVEKSAVQLLSFGKTEVLAPGESVIVELTVNLQWLAAYDYTTAKTYIMDAGDYYFALGNGAHDALNNILAAKGKTVADGMTKNGDASLTWKWTQDALDTETYSTSVYTGTELTNHFDDVDINYWAEGENTVAYLSRNAWDTTYPTTCQITAGENMLASLNDTKKYANGQWNDASSRAEKSDVTYVDAATNESVVNVVVMRGKDYDDEAWDVILDNLTINEMKDLVANGRYYINECPSISLPGSTGSDSPNGLDEPYVYAAIDKETGEKTPIEGSYLVSDGITEDEVDLAPMTASMFASEPVLAATYNQELAYEQGEMFGEDALYHGFSFTWGLGANLHRTALGGRASEYYSADAVHTALMGAAQSRGANSKGHVLVVKHFVANEQEQNRIGVATFTNEQALRENYLRAFEGIATYGGMKGLMTSYNRLGVLGASSEYDLVTTVLREEWGSQCYVITDLNSPTAGLYDGDASIVAGTTTIMNNGTFDAESGAAVNCSLNVENIKNDPILLTAVREACHRILYTFVNSAAVNGVSGTDVIVYITPWWEYAMTGLNIALCVLAVGSASIYLLAVNRKKED